MRIRRNHVVTLHDQVHHRDRHERAVTVDGNHRLAGQTPVFSGGVVSVRKATPDEVEAVGPEESEL